MDDKVITIEELEQLMLTNGKQYDVSKVIAAYHFAAKAHEGQFRSSGQPYIIHPLAVAKSLLELGMMWWRIRRRPRRTLTTASVRRSECWWRA